MRQWIIMASVVIGIGLIGLAVWRSRPAVQNAWNQLTSSVQSERPVRFVVVGDSHGVNPVYRQIIEEIHLGNFAFLLHLADTTENGTAEEFAEVQQLEDRLPFPVYHTVGNHDIKTDRSRGLFVQTFQHGPNTEVSVGQLRLLILDNADRKVGFSAETLDWLDERLRARPHQPFMLAYHRPFGLPLENILGDDETKTSRASNQLFRDRINAAEIVQIFTSHLHTYLTYSLDGIPVVVSGGGGDPAQRVLGGPSQNNFHYLIVTVEKQKPRIEFRSVQLTE